MSNKVNGVSFTTNKGLGLDLVARAHAEMIKSGFLPDFEATVQQEIQSIISKDHKPGQAGKDLRSLLWSSIDNPDSKDLDQWNIASVLKTVM